ncbi:MAG: type II secretion system F family protein [Verrucomicrobiae bacterium]|nr:type II secretion system F family protein [Verrucomicrobiae bacterium]
MNTFTYRALDKSGKTRTGELVAATKTEAYRQLDKEQLQPLSLTLKSGAVSLSAADAKTVPLGSLKLKRSQIITFTEELSDLLDAGLQLEPALRIMEQRDELSSLKDLTIALRQQLREGISFSKALRASSKSFDDLYCNLAQAGELSGALPQILRREHMHLIAMQELQGRVAQSLIYPAFIFVAGVGLLFVFMTFLVPQLTSLFQRTQKKLPLTTQLLISTSDFLAHYWWAIGALVFLLGLAFWQTIQKPAGKRWWDEFRLKTPVIGDVLRAKFYTQFSQTLATMVSNGIPLLNGLRLMRDATPNVFLNNLLGNIIEIVGEGGSLSRAMRKVGHFPPMMIDMIVVGEQTGDLGVALNKVGSRYDKELKKNTERIAAIIPPVIIIVLALVVGAVAVSMITGIFDAVSGMRGGR